MAMINLMPWRQERREDLKKQFYIFVFLSAFSGILIIACIHMFYAAQIDTQEKINEYLKQEIAKIDDQLEKIKHIREQKERLLARMGVIQKLQHNRPNIVELFNEMVRVVPGGLYFQSIKRKKNELIIEGITESNTRVSTLMRNISKSKIFADPILNIIKEGDKENKFNNKFFSLKVKQDDNE